MDGAGGEWGRRFAGLTPGEVVDLSYLLLVEQLERQVTADRLLVATLNASGRYKEQPLPAWADARADFEERLRADPGTTAAGAARADDEQAQLRRALRVV